MPDHIGSQDELQQYELQMHDRLLRGDPTASAEIAEWFLARRPETLMRVIRKLVDTPGDYALADTAADDALLDYFRNPERYDSKKLPLFSYLRMIASRDFKNLLHVTQLQKATSSIDEIVELRQGSSEYDIADSDGFSLEEIVANENSDLWKKVAALFPDRRDITMLRMMMDGERQTSAFAKVLGISNVPPAEVEKEVKRNKDRLKKQVLRHIDRSELK